MTGVHVIRRLIVPLLLLLAIAAVWGFGLNKYLSWAELAQYQATLRTWAGQHAVIAPLAFVLIYTISVALSLPQATLLTLSGGLLFGTALGGSLAIMGATLGAMSLFLIARSAFGDGLARRGGSALATLREALSQDGFSYLLAIRLIPVVPFWLVNLAAALCGIRLSHFVAATLIGIAPATFIFASIGAGLSAVLARGERPDLSVLLSAPVLGPLLGLALLSLAPVIWRKWRAAHA